MSTAQSQGKPDDNQPGPVVMRIGDGKIVYGTRDKNGVVRGKIYEEGQNPEDGPIGDYSNVPWSQHDDPS